MAAEKVCECQRYLRRFLAYLIYASGDAGREDKERLKSAIERAGFDLEDLEVCLGKKLEDTREHLDHAQVFADKEYFDEVVRELDMVAHHLIREACLEEKKEKK